MSNVECSLDLPAEPYFVNWPEPAGADVFIELLSVACHDVRQDIRGFLGKPRIPLGKKQARTRLFAETLGF